jgi:hypothetical protein
VLVIQNPKPKTQMKTNSGVIVNITATTKDKPEDVAKLVQEVSGLLGLKARGVRGSAQKASSDKDNAPRSVGPLEKAWCKHSHRSRVRCTNGRDPEAQARYNLIHYAGRSEAEVDAIAGKATGGNTPAPEKK